MGMADRKEGNEEPDQSKCYYPVSYQKLYREVKDGSKDHQGNKGGRFKEPLNAFPKLGSDVFDLESLDAVIISHAHLDHCGFLPFLYKYGYDGPVYCSEPTTSLMTLLQLDYLDVSKGEGNLTTYDQKDVRNTVLHTMPIRRAQSQIFLLTFD
jgi:predicted metal-dependent RNase